LKVHVIHPAAVLLIPLVMAGPSEAVAQTDVEAASAFAGVVQAPDGTPIAKARLRLWTQKARAPLSTETDAAGGFRFVATGPGPSSLRVEARGFAERWLKDLKPSGALVIVLSRTAIDGTVVDGTTGRPIVGAQIELDSGPPDSARRRGRQAP
jgi:hypothetical protein